MIRNNVPASCVSNPPIKTVFLYGPGRQAAQPAWLLAPSLRWRRRLCSREILQMLHGSRQSSFSVAHPGSVNLDAGAPTALYICDGTYDLTRHRSPADYDTCFPVPGPPNSMSFYLVPACGFLDSSGPAFALSACPVLFAACTSLHSSVVELYAC